MSFNVAMLKAMQAEGLSFDACIRILEAGEKKADATNAVRQARFRSRKKGESNAVTVTVDPPKDNIKPLSVSDETDGEPSDPIKELFDLGVSLLKSQGHNERQARSIIGNWRKGRSPGDVVAALVDAKTRSISNLVEWMPKRLNGRQTGPQGGDYMEQYEREILHRVAN